MLKECLAGVLARWPMPRFCPGFLHDVPMTTLASQPSKRALTDALAPFGQEHVLKFWDELSGDQRAQLAEQLGRLDLAELAELHHDSSAGDDWAALAQRAEGPPAVRLAERRDTKRVRQVIEQGEALLAAGQLGVILVAGGQGTRLGFDKPKGMFAIGPVSGQTLFEILSAKVSALSRRYGVRVPLYLMTSPATHDDTVAFFAAHDRFGLPQDDVHIFCQGTMPAVDLATGRLLLAEKSQLALSPDGHGGMLAALARSGLLTDMRERGLSQLFYLQVDNPLAPVGDPELLGHHLQAASQMTTLAVAKEGPQDRVGNVVSVDGQVRIIEYSDLPVEPAERRAADGSLLLWAGNTAIHIFDRSFLEAMAASRQALPFHRATKKAPHLCPERGWINPAAPNALKFERFVFDLLPNAQRALVIEAEAEQVFAPVKNASGEPRDTPETVRAQMSALHAGWLRQAGVEVVPETPVEISPLLALDADEFLRKLKSREPVREPRYFGPGE